MKTLEIKPAQLPTKKLEEWRYTDVSALAATYTLPPITPARSNSAAGENNVLFVDGLLVSKNLPKGVTISKQTAATSQPDANAIAAVTPATFFEQLGSNVPGYKLTISAGLTLAEPLVVCYQQKTSGTLVRPRLAITIGKGAAIKLIERVEDQPDTKLLATTSVTIDLAQDARLAHQIEQIGSSAAAHIQSRIVTLKKNANYDLTLLSWGATLGRQSLKVQLTEPGAQADLRGVYIARATTQSDYQIEVDHQAPETSSSQSFRGTVSGTGKAVFSGKIIVRPEAKNARAHQLNKTLLLDTTAQMFTRPQLQIETDKVRCSHGASIGRISAESLFYLTSRGLTPELARKQLVGAFLRADLSGVLLADTLPIVDAQIARGV
ncbi:MAG: SufD family Fe-S cluster assembly protein [Candidatus Andersenbacteria bacterium]